MAIRLGGGGLQTYSPEVERSSYIKRTFKPAIGGTSSGRSQASAQAQEAAAQEAARAAQQAAAQEAARQAAAQRATDLKAATDAAALKLTAARGAVAQKETEQQRQSLIDDGARVTTKNSYDVKTGEELLITETRKGGKLIRDVKRGDTTVTNVYAPGKGGGSVAHVGGYSVSGQVKEQPSVEKISKGEEGFLNLNYNQVPTYNNIFGRGNDVKVINKKGGVGVQIDPTTSSYLLKDGKMVYSDNPYTQFDAKFFGGYLPGGKSPKEVARIKEVTTDSKIYDSRSNMFLSSPYGLGAGGTAIMTPPTPSEQAKITSATIRGNAISGAVPLLGQAKFFNYRLTGEQEKDIYGGSILSTVGKFLNPVYQYDLAKDQEQLRLATLDFKDINKGLTSSQAGVYATGLTENDLGNLNNMTLTEPQTAAINKYNAYIDYATGTDSYNKLSESRRTSFDIIATATKTKVTGGITTITPPYGLGAGGTGIIETSIRKEEVVPDRFLKIFTAGVIRTGQTLPYFTPIGRTVFGADIALEGVKSYELADTRTEKLIAGGTTALGVGLAFSGIKGLTAGAGGATGSSITGTANQLKTFKIAAYGSGVALGGSIGAIDYYSTLKATGDKDVALGAALGTGGTLVGGIFGPMAYNKVSDTIRVWGKPKLYTPGIGDKPFIRATVSGNKQLVFYERAGEVKWYNPKTYKYSGRTAGSFYKRQYRIVDPLVEGQTKGLTSINYYGVKDGKVILIKNTATTSFPTDTPSTHTSYFKGTNEGVQQYYIPSKYIPKDILRLTTGSGSTAYPNPTVDSAEFAQYQTYVSGKGLSAYFFRTGSGESGGKLTFGGSGTQKPTAYLSSFENIKTNPAIKEITIPNPYAPGAKGIKQYVLKYDTGSGTLNIPGYKQEVEGVVTGTRTSLGSNYYFDLFGRKIPIESGAYLSSGSGASIPNVPVGSSSGSSGSSSSSIPTGSYVPNVFKTVVIPQTSTKYNDYNSNKGGSYTGPSAISYKSYTSSPVSSSIKSSVVGSPSSSSRSSSVISSVTSSAKSSPVISSVFNSKASSSIRPSSYYSSKGYSYTKPPMTPAKAYPSTGLPFMKLSPKKQSGGFKGFKVFGRRFGKFKPIGVGRTEKEAFSLGKKFASGTLGATFKVPKSKVFKLPGYRTKKTKEGTLFIEPRKRRLKRGSGELPEIQFFKQLKGGKN